MPTPIPAFEANGHLPMGRFTVTLGQIRDRFVADPRFADSQTRAEVWRGLREYLDRWQQYEARFEAVLRGRHLLKAVWLGGSFISAAVDPVNIDINLFADGPALHDCGAAGGKSGLARLTGRERLQKELRVAPTLIEYHYARSPWRLSEFSHGMSKYVGMRGCFDDWWSRVRPAGEDKGEPSERTAGWVRGYLEVILP